MSEDAVAEKATEQTEPETSRPTWSSRLRSVAPAELTPRTITVIVILSVVVLAAILFLPPELAGGAILTIGALYLFRRFVFNWTTLLLLLLAVIWFIPIRRYAIPIPLPFALEPYRLLILGMIVGVIVALITDPAFRWRPVAFAWPIGLFFGTQLLSIIVNAAGLTEHGLDTSAITGLGQLIVLLSTFLVIRQLLSSERIVMLVLTFTVWAGVIVGFFAIVERVARVNVFLLLNNFLPLVLLRDPGESLRAGGARAYASSQHPIALSVALCMVIPIALYLARFGGRPRNEISRRLIYGAGIGILLIGVLCAVSRTAFIVLGVMLALALIFMPRLAALLIACAIPAGVLGALLLPKLFESTLGTLLNPAALLASQYSSIGFRGQGRLADLGPAFDTASQFPFFGTGLGSRIVVGVDQNSNILDNQMLGTLLDTGIVGIIGLAAFLLVPIISLLVFAFRTKAGVQYAMLAFAVATSIAGYTAAMFFYDAFGFMQTFLILDTMLAVGAWLLTEAGARKSAVAAEGLAPADSRVPVRNPA